MLAYAALYVIWGSTYLAMKLAVATVPPFIAASSRFMISGLVLLAVGRAMGAGRITAAHVVTGALQGLFLMVLANGGVMWAMRTVPSGMGALLIAVTPVWMALLSGERQRPTWIGIAVSSVGIAILVDPFADVRAVPISGVVVLLASAFFWAVGSLLPRVRPAHPDTATSTGLQMSLGALMHLGLAVLSGEAITSVPSSASSTSLWALLYLAIFGSLVGFSAYTWLLKVEPAARVATYAYVNPVVAVVLGAAIGREVIDARTVVAAAVIVFGVVVIVQQGRLPGWRRGRA
jgi:drug/metabolite transporter (DMT)-like permease